MREKASPRACLREGYRSSPAMQAKNGHRSSDTTSSSKKERPPAKTGQGPMQERRVQRPSVCRQSSNSRAQREQVIEAHERVRGRASPRRGPSVESSPSRTPSVPVKIGAKRTSSASTPVLTPVLQQSSAGKTTDAGRNKILRGSLKVPLDPSSKSAKTQFEPPSRPVAKISPELPARSVMIPQIKLVLPSSEPELVKLEDQTAGMHTTPRRIRSPTGSFSIATPNALTDSALQKSEELLAEMLATLGVETPRTAQLMCPRLASSDSMQVDGEHCGADTTDPENPTVDAPTTVEVPIALLDMLTETWTKYRDIIENAEDVPGNGKEFEKLTSDLAALQNAARLRESEVTSASGSETRALLPLLSRQIPGNGPETWNQISALRKELGSGSACSSCSTGAPTSLPSPSLVSRSRGAAANSPNSPTADADSPNSQISTMPPSPMPRRLEFESASRSSHPSAAINQTSTEAGDQSPRRSLSPPSWSPIKKEPVNEPSLQSGTPRQPVGGFVAMAPPQPTRILQATSVPAIQRQSSVPVNVPALEFKNLTRPVLQGGSARAPLSPSTQLSSTTRTPVMPSTKLSSREVVLQGSISMPPRKSSPREVQGVSRLISKSPSGSELALKAPVPSQISPRQDKHTPRLVSRQLVPMTVIVDTYM